MLLLQPERSSNLTLLLGRHWFIVAYAVFTIQHDRHASVGPPTRRSVSEPWRVAFTFKIRIIFPGRGSITEIPLRGDWPRKAMAREIGTILI